MEKTKIKEQNGDCGCEDDIRCSMVNGGYPQHYIN